MKIRNGNYIIITPVRNEAAHFSKTIEAVISQTILPKNWIIVDDGSIDGTRDIINKYINRYEWINAIYRNDRGYRKAGSGVIEAFYDGYNSIREKNWEYIVKLDGDLEFSNNYFELCFKIFFEEQKLGIGGGLVLNRTDKGLVIENNPNFHVRGATKIYRKKCWYDINGLEKIIGWDTIDEVKANMIGWRTRTFENIHVIQNKFTGAADGQLKNYIKNGKANYICRYHPLYMVGKIVKRLFERPYIVGSVGLTVGYLKSFMDGNLKVKDQMFKKYIQEQQINKIMGRESIWK